MIHIDFLKRIVINLLKLTVFFYSYVASSQFTWKTINKPESMGTQNCAATSLDGKHAITGGAESTYYTSTDGGITWNKGILNGFHAITSAVYFSVKGVMLSNTDGIVFKTTNHGLSWNEKVIDKGNPLSCIRNIKDSIFIITTKNGKIYRSIDSGENWTLIFSSQSSLNDISIGKNYTTCIVGSNGIIMQSNDLGINWIPTVSKAPDSINLVRISYVQDSTWVIAGNPSFLARTSNNGKSWSSIFIDSTKKNPFYNVSALTFTEYGEGIIVGKDLRSTPTAKIYFTWDGGLSWKRGFNVYFDDVAELIQIADIRFFPKSLSGIVAGAADRVAQIRLIRDSLPFSYERISKVSTLFDRDNPPSFYSQATLSSYFVAEDTNRMQLLREFDKNGIVKKTWKYNDSSMVYTYVNAQYFDDKHSIVFADSTFAKTTVLLFTNDGGVTWHVSRPDSKSRFSRGFWINNSYGLINNSTTGLTTFITTNAGISWVSIPHPKEYGTIIFESLSADSTCFIAIATNNSDKSKDLIRFSESEGWRTIITNIPSGRLVIKNPNSFFIYGSKDIHLLKISSNATSANVQYIGQSNSNSWITNKGKSLWNGNTLLHSENGFDIRYSLDSGMTYIEMNDPLILHYKTMYQSFPNLIRPGSFFSLDKDIVYNTEPRGIAFIGKQSDGTTNIQETTSDIYTNPPYPNPFSKSTTISVDWLFTLSVQSLTLKVYNSIGEEVRDVTKDLHAHAQNYRSSLVFDAGNLPDGVYYVVCKGGPHISSQRLIIAR